MNFILQRYQDSIQGLNHTLKLLGLDNLPKSLNKKELYIFSELLGVETIEGIFLLNSLRKTLNLPGDVCEYGVAQGATSVLIANTIKDSNKDLYLFDSFEGLPKPSLEDGLKDDIFGLGQMSRYEGTMKCPQSNVISRLNKYDLNNNNIKIIPGFIDKTIQNSPDIVSFAFIDFDFYEPIKITLEYLHTKLISGGIFFVDDYDFFSTGVEKAVQEFLKKHIGYDIFIPDKEMGNFCIITKQ